MTLGPKTAAIILAGGSGERFGREGGKQLAPVAGRPVLAWSLAAFDEAASVSTIVLVCPAQRRDEYWTQSVEPFTYKTQILVADSGITRQASAISGMSVLPDDIELVAVHDGARPLVSPKAIDRCVQVLASSGVDGVVLGHPAIDTMKQVSGREVLSTPDRGSLWAAQTPQVFRRERLMAAYRLADSHGFCGTDDSAAMEFAGGSVLMEEGSRDNIKVTNPEDLAYVESVIRSNCMNGEAPCE